VSSRLCDWAVKPATDQEELMDEGRAGADLEVLAMDGGGPTAGESS
jgi:hypothetical protein